MANDLIRWQGPGGDNYRVFDDTEDDNEQWDTPPDMPPRPADFNTQRRMKDGYRVETADSDASAARDRGDHGYASLRETDAAEHRQMMWDWGDFKTWAIILGMCAFYLVMSAAIYFMPHGRHNQNDGPNATPTIRVY